MRAANASKKPVNEDDGWITSQVILKKMLN